MKIITVEHLSKYYTIGHDRNSGVIRYKTFRESMMSAGRSLYQRLRHPLSPNREQVELEEFRALDDVSFEVEQGDRIGIIGRNGAGKSTLLKLLCRITEPTKGRITMRGRVASLLEVGTGFHPELSGRENIYLNGAILGMKRAEIKRKFDEIVAFSGVEKFLDTPVKRYSSGMYVRLAFAVAAHLESEILLIDEVLAVGDAEFQKKCLGKMDDISKNEGRTILFVSHNMEAIRQLCQKGILLKSGQLILSKDIDTCIENYAMTANEERESVIWNNNLSKPISLIGIELRNKKNQKQRIFDVTEPVFIRIQYYVNEKVTGTNIGIGISKDENILFYSWDIDNHPEIFSTTRYIGLHEVEVCLPPVFTNGKYSLSLDCGWPNINTIDSKINCINFVKEHITTDGVLRGSTRGGCLLIKPEWKIIK